MIEIEKVSAAREFDAGSVRYRIGLIVLHTDETTERDFHRMLPGDGQVMYYTARVQTVNPVTIDNLKKMGPELARAASLLVPDVDLDVITYSCTSGTVALGYDEVATQIRGAGRSGIPVVTPLTAAHAAMSKLGIESISLLTPYIDSVTTPMCEYFDARGVRVINARSFYVESDVDIARLSPASVKAGALEAYAGGADALFISCTALRSAEVVTDLEDELGVPVLSSNQCMFWEALRNCGYTKPIGGFGSLMSR